LHELVTQRGEELLGKHHPQARFPLLLKFLDAAQPLSVQVHPDDAQGARLTPPDLGKSEAWVVMRAEPGSAIYAGFKRGFDRAAVEREVSRGTVELCLHRFEPKVGDCVYLPAGTVHALGAGLMVAELQQASDTTFRLFDWNRVGPDGQPRALHVEQALATIDFAREPITPIGTQPIDAAGMECLVHGEKFVLERFRSDRPLTVGGDGQARLLVVLDGELAVEKDASPEPLGTGGTMLLPAGCGAIRLEPVSQVVGLLARLP
jgi:mannose-6-phosphate isomerase